MVEAVTGAIGLPLLLLLASVMVVVGTEEVLSEPGQLVTSEPHEVTVSTSVL